MQQKQFNLPERVFLFPTKSQAARMAANLPKSTLVGFVNSVVPNPSGKKAEQAYSFYKAALIAFQKQLELMEKPAFYVAQDYRSSRLLNIVLKCDLQDPMIFLRRDGYLEISMEIHEGGRDLIYPRGEPAEKALGLYEKLCNSSRVLLAGVRGAADRGIDLLDNVAYSIAKLAKEAGLNLEVGILEKLTVRLP